MNLDALTELKYFLEKIAFDGGGTANILNFMSFSHL